MQNKINENSKNWVIKTENLVKKYKKASFRSVDDLNLEIEKGQIFGILGPNGAGKTTTLSMLCGLMNPTSGKVYYQNLVKANEIKKTIGYVPQELAIYPILTARENIEFFGSLYGIQKKILKDRTIELLKMVGLENRADELIQTYSTGMKRRINLAIGLVHHPEIILLDEPTVGIDPQSRNCIFDAILKLKSQGITILYTTHYMEEATKLCDIVAIMDHGKVIMQGNPNDLVKKNGLYKIHFSLVSGDLTKIDEDLKKFPNISSIHTNENIVTFSVDWSSNKIETIEMINKQALKNNISLSLLKIEEPNLENLFLDLTGRMLRDSSESESNGDLIK
jgi:ABC-2 type transport system ATP-binding protein